MLMKMMQENVVKANRQMKNKLNKNIIKTMKNKTGKKIVGIMMALLISPILLGTWMVNSYSIKDTFNDFYLHLYWYLY